MTNDQIKAIFLAHGFKEKDQGDGRMALNPYVYEAARALLMSAPIGELFACNTCRCPIQQKRPLSTHGITWKAQGEANSYRLMRGGDWFAVIQMNGRPRVEEHEAFLNSLFVAEVSQ